MEVLGLEDVEVVHRKRWTALPIPTEVIDFINSKARQEKVVVDLNVFRMGNTRNAEGISFKLEMAT